MSAWNDDTVVLVDESGAAIGTALKSEVHHESTPLHLAFSCYLFDLEDQLLVTTRASSKPSFPGVLTNSACGHPRPGEPLEDAVRRRVGSELGLEIADMWLVLPEFRYQATSSTGLVEHEICPVFAARAATDDLDLDPSEVDDAEWVPWHEFSAAVVSGEREVSQWCAEQVPQLLALGAGPGAWPAADQARLPAAARDAYA